MSMFTSGGFSAPNSTVNRRVLVLALVALLVVFVVACGQPATGEELQLYFIDIGPAGDAELVIAPTGETLLVDTGNDADTVRRFLNELGIHHVDLLVQSHPHSDHIGGALQVLQNFQVNEVWDVGVPYSNGVYELVLSEIANQVEAGQLTYTKARTGLKAQLGPEVELEVVHPTDPERWENINNTSVAFRLTYEDFSILFTGDIEAEAEEAILKRGASIQATVLKVAHHGSYSSTTPAFLEAVSPAFAVIPAGTDNPYGHPHADTLETLTAHNVEFTSTAASGTIRLTTDGTTYEVQAENEWRTE